MDLSRASFISSHGPGKKKPLSLKGVKLVKKEKNDGSEVLGV